MKRATLYRNIKKVFAPFYRIRLKNYNATIISNNCWGGEIYDKYALPYNSPTIGLYFFSKDYIRFISNLKYYLSLDLQFISAEDAVNSVNIIKNDGKDAIIGVLDDVEIIFSHYSTKKECYDKWNRRKTRVNFDNLLIKCNDQNGFDEEDYRKFQNLNYDNKILLTANKNWAEGKDVVYVKKYRAAGYVINDAAARGFIFTKRFFHVDTTKMLNDMKIH